MNHRLRAAIRRLCLLNFQNSLNAQVPELTGLAQSQAFSLDGHIVMSRQIAERGRYPAVDVLKSLSRLSSHLQGPEEAELVRQVRRLEAIYADMEELIRIGAYNSGADAQTDRAIRLHDGLSEFLTQSESDPTAPDTVLNALSQIYEASA